MEALPSPQPVLHDCPQKDTRIPRLRTAITQKGLSSYTRSPCLPSYEPSLSKDHVGAHDPRKGDQISGSPESPILWTRKPETKRLNGVLRITCQQGLVGAGPGDAWCGTCKLLSHHGLFYTLLSVFWLKNPQWLFGSRSLF